MIPFHNFDFKIYNANYEFNFNINKYFMLAFEKGYLLVITTFYLYVIIILTKLLNKKRPISEIIQKMVLYI